MKIYTIIYLIMIIWRVYIYDNFIEERSGNDQ